MKDWADTCMEFVYKYLGYMKEKVLHATVHLDEKTPHIHCVVVPLVKKFDKRTNTERYTISKKQYIRDKIHLSELQDKYHKRLTDKCYDLERGIKGSDRKHIKIKDYAETEVKQYYDNRDFKMLDVKDVAKGTPQEAELFDYSSVPDQYRTIRTPLYEEESEEDYDYNYEEYDDEIDKDDDMGMSL